MPLEWAPYLAEALQVDDKHVRQRPEAQGDAALLQLLTVWAPPGVIWGKLEMVQLSSGTTGQDLLSQCAKEALGHSQDNSARWASSSVLGPENTSCSWAAL